MTWIDAILLGILQGATEFFPISSSGHLILGQHLLGFAKHDVLFDLVCHGGTLLAILCVFFHQLKELILNKWRMIALATLPLFPLLLILKPIKQLFNSPHYLGFFFLITSALLYLQRFGKERTARSPRHALLIGCAQAVAILPGISRSGATISAAKLLGWSQKEAITFSFLLAIPTILGGAALETLHLYKEGLESQIPLREYCLGFFFSFIVGCITLKLMVRWADGKMGRFALYCAIVGLITLWSFG